MWKEPYDRLSLVVFYFANTSVSNKSYITLIDSNIGGLVLDGKTDKYSPILIITQFTNMA